MFVLHCQQTWLSMMLKRVSKSYLSFMMFLLLLVIGLSACTSSEPRNDSQSVKIEDWVYGKTGQHEAVLMLLNRFKVLGGLSSKKLKAAYKSAERMFSKQPTTVTRLQLAWLLAMKDTRFQNIPRATKLLMNIKQKKGVQKKQSDALNDLVYLVRRIVAERKYEEDKRRLMVKELDEERKISIKLATKIKDLTQIEESMIQRKPLPEIELR